MKIEYLEYKFSDGLHEASMKVRLETQDIHKRDNLKYLQSIIKGCGTLMMIEAYWCSMDEVEACLQSIRAIKTYH